MWARIQNDTVMEIATADPAGRHHPSLVWVAVPAAWQGLIATGCRYVGGYFKPRPVRHPETGVVLGDDLDWLRQVAHRGVATVARQARLAVAGTDDAVEVASWPSKEQIALRYRAGTATPSDLLALQDEADLREQPVADLVARILEKAAAYKVAVGQIDGWRQKTEAAVDGATDAASLVTDLAAHKATAAEQLATVLADIANA